MIKTEDIVTGEGNLFEFFKVRFEECLGSYPVFRDRKLAVCVDIGANIGCFSIFGSPFFENIYALEPVEQNFNIMNKIISHLGKNNIKTYKIGVSDKNSKNIKIYNQHGRSGDCCIYKSDSKNGQKEYQSETIEVVDFETLFSMLNVDFIDYLKIDCEGSEYSFLYNQDLSRVGTIAIEIHGPPDGCNISQSEFILFLCKNFESAFTKEYIFFGLNRNGPGMDKTPEAINKDFELCYKSIFGKSHTQNDVE